MTVNAEQLNTASLIAKTDSDQSRQWKNLMDKIIDSMRCPDDQYKPLDTIAAIVPLLKSDFKRPMYSWLSTQMLRVNNDDEEGEQVKIQAYLISNCERLFEYAFAVEHEDEIKGQDVNPVEIRAAVIRIYDDLNLASLQNEAILANLNRSTEKVVKNARDTVNEDIKEMQRTYISAFTVLASILFGLVGGIAFSFEGIKQGASFDNIYDLLAVISILGAFFVAILSALIWLISWLAKGKGSSSEVTGKSHVLLPISIAIIMFVFACIFADLAAQT